NDDRRVPRQLLHADREARAAQSDAGGTARLHPHLRRSLLELLHAPPRRSVGDGRRLLRPQPRPDRTRPEPDRTPPRTQLLWHVFALTPGLSARHRPSRERLPRRRRCLPAERTMIAAWVRGHPGCCSQLLSFRYW